jgi:hypothetical protein
LRQEKPGKEVRYLNDSEILRRNPAGENPARQRLAASRKRVLRVPTTAAAGGSTRSVDSEGRGRVMEPRNGGHGRGPRRPSRRGQHRRAARQREKRLGIGMRHRQERELERKLAGTATPRTCHRPRRLGTSDLTGVREHGTSPRGFPRNLGEPVVSAPSEARGRYCGPK